MKKIFFLLILILVILITFYFRDSKILKLEDKYTLVNEKGNKIPATLYSRIVNVKINNKSENIYEILIFFDKKIKTSFNPIIIIPKYKLIGLPDGNMKDFIEFDNKMIQLSKESNQFTSLDGAFFAPYPPIKKILFKNDYIVFNSFDGLKEYGNNITLKLK